jgi:hypothetical protein
LGGPSKANHIQGATRTPNKESRGKKTELPTPPRLRPAQLLERITPDNKDVLLPQLAVKRFVRTINDTNNGPEHMRTRTALRKTMRHLRRLGDLPGQSLSSVYPFVWDRHRGVRLDITTQHICSTFAVRFMLKGGLLCAHHEG